MIKISVYDWFGNCYKIKVMQIPNVNEDFQVGIGDDKRVRGIVKNVERTVGKDHDCIDVYLLDDLNQLNDGSSFEGCDWW